jgi:hypothetical protein
VLPLLRALTQLLHQRPLLLVERARDRGRQLRERGTLLFETMELLERQQGRHERSRTVQVYVPVDGVDVPDLNERPHQ